MRRVILFVLLPQFIGTLSAGFAAVFYIAEEVARCWVAIAALWALYADTNVGSSENRYIGRSFSPQASSPIAPQYP